MSEKNEHSYSSCKTCRVNMQFEYILLLIISFFPLYYKFAYWGEIFSREKSIQSYLRLKTFREDYYHFMLYLEIPLFLASFSIFYNPLLEIFLFNMVFYFLLLYNIFVFWKIFRRKFPHISFTQVLFPLVFFILIGTVMLFCIPRWIYFFLLWGLLFMPIVFILSSYVSFNSKKD